LKSIRRAAILASASPLHKFTRTDHDMTRFFAIGLSLFALAAVWRWFRRVGTNTDIRNVTLSRQWLAEHHAGDRT
jgi:hypothetical protein